MAVLNPTLQQIGAPAVPRTRTKLAYKWLVLMVVLPGMTLFTIDITVVNVALAKLGAVYGVSLDTVQWAITGYALASAIATPLAGYVERRFTMKRVWVIGLSTFTVASVLCGVAPLFWVLVLGRILQGFAGGLLIPMLVSIIFEVFPADERGSALGFFAIPIVAGPALGPTLGGYIITNWDWRLVFFINLPIGIGAVLLGLLLLRRGVPQPVGRFDGWGFVLAALAFGLTLVGVSQVGGQGWGSLSVRGLIGGGLLSLLAFITYELRHPDPLLDVRMFAIPQFLNSNIVGWVSTVALFGAEFMLPLYLQNLRGLSAVETGWMLMPQGLAIAFAGPIAGRLVDRIGARWIVMIGFVLMAVNTFQLSQLTLTTDFGTLRWLLVARGLALGCTMQPTTLTAIAAVPAELRTNATSLVTAMRGVWQSFGVAMLATLVQSQTVVHTAVLGWQVRPETSEGQFLAQIGASLVQTGLSDAAANLAATALVMNQIAQQAAVLGFADAYRVSFVAALIAFGLALLLPGRGAIPIDRAAMAGGE
jgi:MFS transporter, DHA2 family, multidrug resistance protein